jgi:hypothetical protein
VNGTLFALLVQSPLYVCGALVVGHALVVRGREVKRRNEQEGPPQTLAQWWDRCE